MSKLLVSADKMMNKYTKLQLCKVDSRAHPRSTSKSKVAKGLYG